MSKIRVLIVEPGKEPYEARIENTLGTLQSIVDGYIEMIPMESGVDLIVNDEGKCLNLPFNRYITGNMLVGTIIVTGVKNGETISLSPELVEKYKKYFALRNHQHLVEYFKAAYNQDKSLVTVEVKNNKVIQSRIKYNEQPNAIQLLFLKKWQEQILQKCRV